VSSVPLNFTCVSTRAHQFCSRSRKFESKIVWK
jgi:hypothetical protein